MSHVMRASDIIGLPVVSIDSGEDIAEIRDVLYDGGEHRLLGFTLNKRGLLAGRMRDALPASSVEAIGADAVMVAGESDLAPAPGGADDLAGGGEPMPIVGNRVVTADGNVLGEVVGVVVETGDEHRAVGYEIAADDRSDTMFVPISAQMALSATNLLLPEGATDFVRDDLAGFGAAVDDYRARLGESR